LLVRVEPLDPVLTLRAAQGSDDLAKILAAADVEVASGDVAAGFKRLTTAIAATSGADRDTLRARLLELFDTQDPSDPAVLKARRDLTTALF